MIPLTVQFPPIPIPAAGPSPATFHLQVGCWWSLQWPYRSRTLIQISLYTDCNPPEGRVCPLVTASICHNAWYTVGSWNFFNIYLFIWQDQLLVAASSIFVVACWIFRLLHTESWVIACKFELCQVGSRSLTKHRTWVSCTDSMESVTEPPGKSQIL